MNKHLQQENADPRIEDASLCILFFLMCFLFSFLSKYKKYH